MVTVLMSVWETPRELLQRAIGSILEQSYSDFEFLIVDDGSCDGETTGCLASIADLRLRLVRLPHRGLTAALNVGLRLARGEWIARQDADDWSEPDRLMRQLAFLAAHSDHVLAGSAAWMHQQNGARLWPARMPDSHDRIVAALPRGNPFFHGSAMFRRDAALAVGGYREELVCSQDYDFFWRLSETGRAANLPELLYHYRYGAASVSASRAAEQARSHRAARRLALQRRAGQAENVAAALHGELGPGDALAARLRQADHLMLAGDYRQAARAYRAAIQAHPDHARAWAKLLRLGIFRSFPPARAYLWGGLAAATR